MNDSISQSAPRACPLPSVAAQRLPYVEPKLTVFGNLANLTQAVGNTGRPDGGLTFGFMSSGV